MLTHRLEGLETDALAHAFASATIAQWVIVTGPGFLALARYDVIAHRHFATGPAGKRAPHNDYEEKRVAPATPA